MRFNQFAQLKDVRQRLLLVDQQTCERSHEGFNRKIDDKIPHTGSADNETLAFQGAQRLAHRSPADFKGLGQLALGGKLIARFESALPDQLVNLAEDFLVDTGFLDRLEHIWVQLSAGQTTNSWKEV